MRFREIERLKELAAESGSLATSWRILTHVDGSWEGLGLGEHSESIVKVCYVVLGSLFVREHRLVALHH